MIPPKPVIPSGATNETIAKIWDRWADEHYPFSERARRFLATRQNAPELRLEVQLEDLRGVPPNTARGYFASLIFRAYENHGEVSRAHANDRVVEQQKERRRLIGIATQALDGKLGHGRTECDSAAKVAQRMLAQSPQFCTDDDLADWWKIHQYSKAKLAGKNPPYPKLAIDLRAAAQQKHELNDLDSAIGGAQGELGM